MNKVDSVIAVAKPTWEVDRLRKEMSKLVMGLKLSLWTALKDQPELLKTVQDAYMIGWSEQLKAQGINTPIALVKYLAELSVNLIETKVSYSGDEKSAWISYDELAGWPAIQEKLELTPEAKEKMAKLGSEAMQRFGKFMEMDCEAQYPLSTPLAKITFYKRG